MMGQTLDFAQWLALVSNDIQLIKFIMKSLLYQLLV